MFRIIGTSRKYLSVAGERGRGERRLQIIRGDKYYCLCLGRLPSVMVATVIKARQIADQDKGVQLIVAPLQQLSETHLLMNRMVSKGNMLFIDDEKWRKENLEMEIRLPLFVPLGMIYHCQHEPQPNSNYPLVEILCDLLQFMKIIFHF